MSSQQQPSSSDEQMEGTVVTEADSGCEPLPEPDRGAVSDEGGVVCDEEGGVVCKGGGVDSVMEKEKGAEEEAGSCEAETREADSVSEPVAETTEQGLTEAKEEENDSIKEEMEVSCEAEAREVRAYKVKFTYHIIM